MNAQKPIVLVDVDGILANFIQAALDIVEDVSGKKYHHDDIKTWDVFDSLVEHKHLMDDVYGALKSQHGCYNIPIYDGAQEGVRALQQVAHVIILTSPFGGSRTWMREREQWLVNHFNISPKDIFHGHHKHLVRGDIFIDDKVEHIEAWSQAHPKSAGRLWTREYNKSSTLPRVSTWEEVLELCSMWRPSFRA